MEDLDDIFDEEVLDPSIDPINENEDNNIVNDDDIFDNDDDLLDDEVDSSIIGKFLSSKGIVDSKIKIVDEYNQESEVLFSELPEDEQLELLQSLTTEVYAPSGDTEEDHFISELRNQGMGINDFLERYKEMVLEEAGQTNATSYEIDSYDDKELFLLDLKNKFDLNEEELQAELEKELQNEELFKRKIDKIREEYKTLEENYLAEERAQFEATQQQQYSQFVDSVVGVANNVQNFHGLELEDEEINNTLSYLLDLDDSGTSQMSRDLNNPANLYRVAWYLRYGDAAFRMIEDAYEQEISKLRKQIDKPKVVKRNTNNNNKNYKSIHELN